MKKIYFAGLTTLLVGGTAIAQNSEITFKGKMSREEGFNRTRTTIAPSYAKAPNDTIWFDDFSSGTGWTASNQGAHTAGDWAIVSAMPASLTSQVPPYDFPIAMNSNSGGNFAIIDSDAEGGAATQDALLTLDTPIDLSAMGTTSLSIRFTEIYRHYYDYNFVEVSNDNGTTWTTFAVNTVATVPVNTNSGDPEFEDVNISSAMATAGSWGSQVLIRFWYQGQWDWFWGIDDVAIVETPADDLNVSSSKTHYTSATIQYSQIPLSQVVDMSFDANVTNVGGADQTTSQLDVTVSGAGSFSGSSPSTNIAVGTSTKLSVNGYTPTAIGTYDVAFNVYDPATTDNTPANNVAFGTFDITSNTYARDTGSLDGWYAPFDDDSDMIDDPMEFIGQFEMNAAADITAIQAVFASNSTGGTPVGQEIYYNVYSDDGAGGFLPVYDGLGTPIPTYTLTAGDITSSTGSTTNWVNLPLPAPVNADPAVSANWYPVVGYSVDGFHMAVSGDAADTTNFLTVFATTAGQSNYFITSIPMLRLVMPGASGIEDTDVSLDLGQNMPNPFNGTTVIPFTLSQASDVSFIVTDVTGKIIDSKELGILSSGEQRIEFDGSNLAGGVYYYSVVIDGKKSTKQFSVVK
mgnify:FL=1